MKVLAVSASPRDGGNSDVLCDQFLKGAADVSILATPVYFYSMNAQMKAFIDRCLPRYQEIRNKMFYYIITAADPQHSAADETIAGLRGYLRCLPGAQEKGIIYGTGTWDLNDVYRHPAFDKAYETGKNI